MEPRQIVYFPDDDPPLTTSQLNQPGGPAGLDPDGAIVVAQLPPAVAAAASAAATIYLGVLEAAGAGLASGGLAISPGAAWGDAVQPAGSYFIVGAGTTLAAGLDAMNSGDILAQGARVLSDGTRWRYDGSRYLITSRELFDGAVTASKLAAGAVRAPAIDDGAVTALKLATGSVGTVAVSDGAITSAKLASGSVGTAAIANAAVTSAKLASGSVGVAAIADAAVTSAKLASGSVGTAAIADAAVTIAKISASGTPSGSTMLTGDGAWTDYGAIMAGGDYRGMFSERLTLLVSLNTSVNNYKPGGIWPECSRLIVNNTHTSAITITGIIADGVPDGQIVLFQNSTSSRERITLTSGSASSGINNRFAFSSSVTIAIGASKILIYSGGRWTSH